MIKPLSVVRPRMKVKRQEELCLNFFTYSHIPMTFSMMGAMS